MKRSYVNVGVVRGVRRPHFVRVPCKVGYGFSREPDGQNIADLEVLVDVEELVRALASKAMRSKAKVSRLQGGAVVVRVARMHHEREVAA